jgi:aspartate-semialdehyde dehydrogenase
MYTHNREKETRAMKRIPIAILGATGAVGQRMIQLLQGHPWFEIAVLTGSDRTVGRPYGELVNWVLDGAPPAHVANMIVQPTDTVDASVAIALSALPTAAAQQYEPLWAAHTAVCSNASAYRMTTDVPLIIPEVNPDHVHLIDVQRRIRGWRGALVTNPNCSVIGMAMALKPLHDTLGIQQVNVATLQAVSGAGYPGVASLDILDNIIPNIGNGTEEEKIESEPGKILAKLHHDALVTASFAVSAQVTRVPVIDGHTALLSIQTERKLGIDDIERIYTSYQAPQQVRELPSSPERALVIHHAADRPQPRRDRDAGGGMSVSVGRIRPCPINDIRMVVLSHNTIRGAAGGAILNAELLVATGYANN